MDNIQLQKIHAINKAKKQQLLGKVFLCSLTVLTCSFFCSSLFWFPNIPSSMKMFLSVSVPNIGAIFLSPKSIFIVGNLIVIVLYGESKFFASSSPPASDVYYNEYINRKGSLQSSSTPKEKKKRVESVTEEASKTFEDGGNRKKMSDRSVKVEKERAYLDREDELRFPTEELNKRADDFIARVNRQFRLEAKALVS